MLFYKDRTIHASKAQAKSHIYYDHDYHDKLRVARIINLISDDEKRSATWLAEHLVELSMLKEVV